MVAFRWQFNSTGCHHIKTECGKAYSLECHNVSWDGSRFGMGMENINIFEFRGVKHIKSLRAFPFAFHPDRESVIQRLTERGRVFESLAGAQYKAYNGLAIDRDNENNEIRVNVTGRIVVDAASWNKFSAHSTVYLDAIPHTELTTQPAMPRTVMKRPSAGSSLVTSLPMGKSHISG